MTQYKYNINSKVRMIKILNSQLITVILSTYMHIKLIVLFCISFCSLGFASNGIDIIAEVSNFSPYYSNYGRLVTCQIIKKTDGTLLTLYARDNDFTVSITDSDEKIIFYKEIPFELPIFGAFFDGKEYNFAIFGQFNPDENDDAR